MTNINDVIYTKRILEFLKTYVIDGVVVKERNGNVNLSNNEIEHKIELYENIGIQKNGVIDVYCDEATYNHIDNMLKDNRFPYMVEAYESSLINLHTKDNV